MNKDEILRYLQNSPVRYDNNSYEAFLSEVGYPILPPAIHITGTNGKGSSTHYLALALQHSGYLVGQFISPHFAKVNELVSVNGDEISDAFISEQIEKYDFQFKKYALSLFEMMTFIAFNYFIAQKVDYVVIEVGMGGQKDATNIFTPLLSIITNISLDHLKELGPTIKDVAMHKAGIIKEGIPLLCGPLTGGAKQVITGVAAQKKAPLYMVSDDYEIIQKDALSLTFKYEENTYDLNNGADYEVKNAILVLNALKILESLGVKVNAEGVQKSFASPVFLGRFTVLSSIPLVIVDGAHNEHAMKALIKSIKTLNKKVKIIFAAFKDKEYEKEIRLLKREGWEITLTSFLHPRAENNYRVKDLPFETDYRHLIKHSFQNLEPNDLLLIVGSLYFSVLVTTEWKKEAMK